MKRLIVALAVVVAVAAAWMRFRPGRVDVGSVAPDFTATDVRTGKTVTLHSDYRGAVTLVNVWATYCGPCRQEMPAMDSLYRDLGPRGFRIAAVSIDFDSVAIVKRFVADYHITFDVLHDAKGAIQEIYQTTGVPESFLVDRSGHIIRIAQLAAPWNSPENHRIIEELLAAPAS